MKSFNKDSIMIVNRTGKQLVANCETIKPSTGTRFDKPENNIMNVHSDIGSAIIEYNPSLGYYEFTTFGELFVLEQHRNTFDIVNKNEVLREPYTVKLKCDCEFVTKVKSSNYEDALNQGKRIIGEFVNGLNRDDRVSVSIENARITLSY